MIQPDDVVEYPVVDPVAVERVVSAIRKHSITGTIPAPIPWPDDESKKRRPSATRL